MVKGVNFPTAKKQSTGVSTERGPNLVSACGRRQVQFRGIYQSVLKEAKPERDPHSGMMFCTVSTLIIDFLSASLPLNHSAILQTERQMNIDVTLAASFHKSTACEHAKNNNEMMVSGTCSTITSKNIICQPASQPASQD